MNLIGKAWKVIVGISGGVDSAVAAYLLKKKGYDVIGVFMTNWDIVDEYGFCTGANDRRDAEEVCSILKIPFHEVNFVREYWTEVFDYFVNDYKKGLTPNPDILCNKNIKFKYFLNYAIENFGGNAIATGHYARVSIMDSGQARLLMARDILKDQTFFLSQIPQIGLQKSIFPLGNLLKSEVKKIARENKLEKYASKKESNGICFIGQRNFQKFISEYVNNVQGNFIDIDTRKIVGTHKGKHYFTIGQRCKIPSVIKPYYVARKTETEDVLVAMGHNHPVLFNNILETDEPFWIYSEPQEITYSSDLYCKFRFQHRNPLIGCRVSQSTLRNRLSIELEKPLRAVTPGQYAVLYRDNECLGSAKIINVGQTSVQQMVLES